MKFKKITAAALSASVLLSTQPLTLAALIDSVQKNGTGVVISGKTTANDVIGIYTMRETEKHYGYRETELGELTNIGYAEANADGEYTWSGTVGEGDGTLYLSSMSGEKDVVRLSSEAAREYRYQVYISPDGDDSTADGSYSKPFGTIAAAQKKVRSIKSSSDYDGGDIAISFFGGTYRIGKISLGSEDSGSANGRIVYRAYNDDEVRLTNSVKLDISKLKPIEDLSVKKRLPVTAQEKVYELDLSELIPENAYIGYGYMYEMNTVVAGRRGKTRLFLNETPQTISRWPNVGYKDLLLKDGSSSVINSGAAVTDETTGITRYNDIVLAYDDANISRWGSADDVVIRSYFRQAFGGHSYDIKGIDTVNKQLTLDNVYKDGITLNNTLNAERRWYAENLLEEIDLPGEYYIDEDAKKLYYYPQHELTSADELELVCGEDGFGVNMFSLLGVSYVSFEGLKLDGVSYKGFSITDSSNIEIDGCTIGNTQSNGVQINSGCCEITVKSCTIYNTMASGIYAEPSVSNEDIAALKNTGIVLENNHIYKSGENSTYPWPAIHSGGVGDLVINNTLHQMPVDGVEFASPNGSFIYNEVYMAVYDSTDTGALHVGGDWRRYGTSVEYNYIHDLGQEGMTDARSTWPIAGIYWDEVHSGTTNNNNFIIHNSAGSTRGIFMNGGRDHTAEGNVIVGAKTAFWNPNGHSSYYLPDPSSGLALHPSHSGLTLTYEKFLEFYSYAKANNTEYYQTYGAKMDELASDIETYQLFSAKNLRFTSNVLADCGTELKLTGDSGADNPLTEKQTRRKYKTNDSFDLVDIDFTSTVKADNYTAEDTGVFVNPELGDYRVTDEGKAALGITGGSFKLGEDFDITKIGCKTEPVLGSFSLTYPKNGERISTGDTAELAWEPLLFADEYEYTVYKKDGSVAASGKTMYTSVTVSGLSPNSEYTWEVTARYGSAISKIKNNGALSAENTGGAQSFMTSVSGVEIEDISYDTERGKLRYSINNSGSAQNARLIIASYDSTGKLLTCKAAPISIPEGSTEAELDPDGADFANEAFKAFVWTADATIKPLTGGGVYVK